jgi:hypothetical protein
MRFTALTTLALPLLAAAAQQQDPLTQAMESAQYYFDKVRGWIPHTNTFQAVEELAAKAGGNNLEVLTLDNWQKTLRGSVTGKGPTEWWILVTGGNKTCWGQCDKMNTAFNETALLWAADPTAPRLGYINCDLQPILCNAWAAGPPSIYFMEVTHQPNPVEVHYQNLNTTTTTVKTVTELRSTKSYLESPAYEGYFHPFDGPLAQYGLTLPMAYTLWFFAIVPSWAFMILVSFMSRTVL